jgi:phenylpyruvate tautomerase PptA (4-oxalocrotonate tautomerase family)
MPFYQFTVPSDSLSAKLKADIATAVTKVHTDVTGAPAHYVNVSFTEVPSGSIFVAGKVVPYGRMVGLIRSGRSPETKRKLITELAAAWSQVTGEPMEGFALFIVEQPGSSIMEDGKILPEASED